MQAKVLRHFRNGFRFEVEAEVAVVPFQGLAQGSASFRIALLPPFRMSLLVRFYTALAARDAAAMAACYHPQVHFSDPVFPDLDAAGVKAMWSMLLERGTDLRITFRVVEENAVHGVGACDAWYTFTATGRAVHNRISGSFEFRDGLIYRQQDRFNFWRWSRQALGWRGLLLGWTSFLQRKIQSTAAKQLAGSTLKAPPSPTL
jgi:ketosteroid isomerase-like protein